jgi:hypothetical protein
MRLEDMLDFEAVLLRQIDINLAIPARIDYSGAVA